MRISALVLASAASISIAMGAAAQEAKTPPPGAAAAAAPPEGLKSISAQASYGIGLKIGMTMRREGADVDPAILARGLRDGLSGTTPALTEDQIQAAVTAMRSKVLERARLAASQAGAANRAEGEAFLKANAAKPGVVTLPSGLEYQVMSAGAGPKPTLADTVSCNYRGTLLNGKEFDSSYARGTPADFPVSGVIKGWTEALQRMAVGSKWRLFVPADLAYGDKGAGDDIGPGATLIFDVELLAIKGAG